MQFVVNHIDTYSQSKAENSGWQKVSRGYQIKLSLLTKYDDINEAYRYLAVFDVSPNYIDEVQEYETDT